MVATMVTYGGSTSDTNRPDNLMLFGISIITLHVNISTIHTILCVIPVSWTDDLQKKIITH